MLAVTSAEVLLWTMCLRIRLVSSCILYGKTIIMEVQKSPNSHSNELQNLWQAMGTPKTCGQLVRNTGTLGTLLTEGSEVVVVVVRDVIFVKSEASSR